MSYISQVITVTRWEFRRFFKPKNEAMGIIVMLFISVIFYFGGKIALSDTGEKPLLYVLQDSDSSLNKRLSDDFKLKLLPDAQKSAVLEQISNQKEGILLVDEGNAFTIHAYKKTRVIKKLKAVLDVHFRTQMMKSKGWSETDLSMVLSAAPAKELFIYSDNSNNRIVLSFFFAGLMILAVFLSFAYQFSAITGEKQLKITEQIVSAISPQVWMDGKIFGITLTGLSSMLTYSVLGIIGGVLYFQFTGVPVSSIMGYLHLPSILLFLPFALTGILLWNALLAAIASVITDPNNSGKSGLMMLPILFVMASFLVSRDPDSRLAVFLSWFPLTSPTAMPMRWAVTEVGFWQPAGSFILLMLTFYFLRRLAAKVFRVSILMSGKEPSWSEVIKLARNTD
ncbi:MAG: ABC transporter permease [Bacteroidota bacterium]